MRWLVLAAMLTAACANDAAPAAQPTSRPTAPAPAVSATAALPTTAPTPSTTATLSPTPTGAVVVAYRVQDRTGDFPGFAADITRTLTDPRGWSRADFRLTKSSTAEYVVVLAEADEVDRLCLPYKTFAKYSCQNGPVVALNADRWRTATPKWTGDLAAYRQMLVNHEVGHLLGQHHPPSPQCPTPGRLALVMSQQSTELNGCLPNPWPLPAEVVRAAKHDLPLAPPYEP